MTQELKPGMLVTPPVGTNRFTAANNTLHRVAMVSTVKPFKLITLTGTPILPVGQVSPVCMADPSVVNAALGAYDSRPAVPYYQSPCELDIRGPGKSVFLAGGITGCSDWQSIAARYLLDREISVFNPRRANFDVTDAKAAIAQVEWEFKALRQADVILFWFPESLTTQPIALFELGFWSGVGRGTIVVGSAPGYPRTFDVIKQMELLSRLSANPITVHGSLEETLATAVDKVNTPP